MPKHYIQKKKEKSYKPKPSLHILSTKASHSKNPTNKDINFDNPRACSRYLNKSHFYVSSSFGATGYGLFSSGNRSFVFDQYIPELVVVRFNYSTILTAGTNDNLKLSSDVLVQLAALQLDKFSAYKNMYTHM